MRRRNFSCHAIDVEACKAACEAVVASKGNSYLVAEESQIKDFYRPEKTQQGFFKLEDKILKPLSVPERARQYAASRAEIRKQGAFLKKTDWIVVKCLELGIAVSEKYPTLHQQRTQARTQINQKQQEINQL